MLADSPTPSSKSRSKRPPSRNRSARQLGWFATADVVGQLLDQPRIDRRPHGSFGKLILSDIARQHDVASAHRGGDAWRRARLTLNEARMHWMPPNSPVVTVEVAHNIATVTLDRPPVNAVDPAAIAEIRDSFRSLDERRDVRVAIFTAAGDRAFMAGADLRAPVERDRGSDVPATLITDPARAARDAMWAISDCAVPVIGAINGPALGAGVAFAACCDILLASENATFGATEINVGFLGASAHLSLLVGRHKAREMFFTGEVATAAELYRLGALRAVVPRADLLGAARELAATLAAKSPIALRLAKEAMNRVEYLPLKEAYRTEQDYTARLLGFEDSAEARQAYLDKRPPEWRWR